MRKFFLPVFLLMTCTLLTSFTGRQMASFKSVSPVIFEDVIMDGVEMYNNCTGETVQLEGVAQMLTISMENKNRINYVFHMNMQGVTGVGETSGTIYHISNPINYSSSTPKTDGASTVTGIFRGNVAGGGKSFRWNGSFHTTINANGTTTSNFDNTSISCE